MSKKLNHLARDSLMGQITTAIETLKERRESLDLTIQLYHQAQNSSLSEPMDEVSKLLGMVSKRIQKAVFKENEDKLYKKAENLAKVAEEIKQSEV